MAQFSFQFDPSGKHWFESEFDGQVSLSKETWEKHILGKPERNHLKFNTEKIATTLVIPDLVRESLDEGPEAHLYYKEFPDYQILEGITVPCPRYMQYVVVVVKTSSKRVSTVYGAKVVKHGKAVKGG